MSDSSIRAVRGRLAATLGSVLESVRSLAAHRNHAGSHEGAFAPLGQAGVFRPCCLDDCCLGGVLPQSQEIGVDAAAQRTSLGVAQVSEHIWLVTFMDYDLGYFDDETCRLEPIENPFRPKVLPMSPE